MIAVREMRPEDIPQVQPIDREGFPNDWPPPDFKRELRNSMSHYMVATEVNSEEGITAASPAPPRGLARLLHRLRQARDHPAPSGSNPILGFCGMWFMLEEAHIISIAVKASHRRQGLGELLLASAIDRAAERGCTYVTLEVRASNLGAQALYRKYGFLQTGVRPRYYTDNDEDALVMTTDIITSASYQSSLHRLKQQLQLKLNPSA